MKKWAIAVEIGGTKLQVALGDEEGNALILRQGKVDPAVGAPGILAWLEDVIAEVIEEAKSSHRTPTAIGIGFGGPVERATGEVLVSHQVLGWENVQLKTWCEERFGLITIVENDSNAAGWAEYKLGAGQGADPFCYMNIGSGIGGALVLNGKLHNGQGRGAGENGHLWVPDWTSDEAGASDKLEHLCSGWSIENRIRAWKDLEAGSPLYECCKGDAENLTCSLLARAAEQGDVRALAEIERIAHSVGLALANVITLFHPERIAMGGGVSLMGDILLDPIRKTVDQLVFGPFKGRYEIVPCALEEQVVVAGALLLATDL